MKKNKNYYMLNPPIFHNVIDGRNIKKNGNGVYLYKNYANYYSIVVVYNNAYMTDYIIVYKSGKFAGDQYHTRTTMKAIISLIAKYKTQLQPKHN